MDIQAEKLHLIEWLAGLNDVKVIQEIKALKKRRLKICLSVIQIRIWLTGLKRR